MANIKRVLIRGWVPFYIADDEDCAVILGRLNTPSSGVRISYSDTRLVPNAGGGETTMYRFDITGEAGVTFAWLEHVVTTFENGGAELEHASATDIEDIESTARYGGYVLRG